ncbi:MAG: HvfC/BufC family peptide modification chaperone [Steroidobacteraceae bacterium]
MPALLELQRAWSAQLLSDAPLLGVADAPGFAIYRDTACSTLVNALRLSFPAVERLVGAQFFDAAARSFVREHAPEGAYLNDYGDQLPQFLQSFAPAAGVVYLAEVARLEWAVNRALHASDVPGLSLTRLRALDEAALARVCFMAHPSLSLLQLSFPADAIWRAVLEQDDAAMAAIDLTSGPVRLLIERDAGGVQVRRLGVPAFDFAAQLCSGRPLYAAIAPESEAECHAWLAQHLRAGRFIDFHLTEPAAGESAA